LSGNSEKQSSQKGQVLVCHYGPLTVCCAEFTNSFFVIELKKVQSRRWLTESALNFIKCHPDGIMLPGKIIVIYSLQFIVRSSTLLIKFLVGLHNPACFVKEKSSNSRQVVILRREYKGTQIRITGMTRSRAV
jgi:hypothetical protein